MKPRALRGRLALPLKALRALATFRLRLEIFALPIEWILYKKIRVAANLLFPRSRSAPSREMEHI
jgi:hypothetical protein